MSSLKQRSVLVVSLVVVALVLASAAPAEAQSKYGPLFDKFNFKLAGSWLAMSTEIRLDSETHGVGTVLNFEDDLDLGSDKTVPTLAFEWQMGRKHKLGVRWQDIDRASTSQALTEIQWGDETIPIDANINLGYDIAQTFIDYTYYPWVKDRWAAGFGIGLRVMDFQVTLAWNEEGGLVEEGSSDVKATGPLPYLYFEYRRLFSDNWRFITGYGWLYIEIGDVKGGQWIGRVGIEYLLGDRWAFGGTLNAAKIDVDWKGIDNPDGDSLLSAGFDMDITDVTIFARIRF
ncbi:MAG: hypothetical protein DRJ65_21260 [Acidobacteria bacterium]|nr:MAG: hypothetical protein DRJ65_21260 [Acidobacteriota bacterium]